jgi:hypothetical protein
MNAELLCTRKFLVFMRSMLQVVYHEHHVRSGTLDRGDLDPVVTSEEGFSKLVARLVISDALPSIVRLAPCAPA